MKLTFLVFAAALLVAACTTTAPMPTAVIVSVTLNVPRSTAEIVESRVTALIERSLTFVAGVEVVRSRTSEASSYLEVTFHQTPKAEAVRAVEAAVAQLALQLPSGSAPPVVRLLPGPTLSSR